MRATTLLFSTLVLFFLFSFDSSNRPLTKSLLDGTIIYVNSEATGIDNGTSWNDAFNDLQDALAIAQPEDSIWVAAGVYLPTTGNDRSATFLLPNEVAIYGGFDGTETSLLERDWQTNQTILSGDIGVPNMDTDNSFHVVFGQDLNNNTQLNGFIIEKGNADGGEFPGPDQFGGGLSLVASALNVRNCHFQNNNALFLGGAAYFEGGSPQMQDCTFEDNQCRQDGGAVFVLNATENGSEQANFDRCHFLRNQARQGSAVKLFVNDTLAASPVVFRECTFVENGLFESGFITEGGAVFNQTMLAHRFEACTFTGNFANRGGAVRNHYPEGVVRAGFYDCLFTENYTSITGSSGGGAVADGSPGPAATTYLSCRFTNNQADHGGGYYYTFSSMSPRLINCIFDSNQGGGAYLDCANAYFGNCTFYNNSLPGIATLSCSAPLIENCIFWDNFITNIGSFNNNPMFRRCLVPGDDCSALDFAQCEDVIFGEDPLFIEPDSGDFRLMICSPARNAGDNNLLQDDIETDIAGMQRVVDGQVDIGAHEFLDPEPQFRLTDVTKGEDSRKPRTFRSSMICANTLPGPDTIHFFPNEADTLLIYPLETLPELRDDSTVIDVSNLSLGKVTLDGSVVESLTGVPVYGGINIRGNGIEIYGLTIRNWPRSGIYFQGIANGAQIGAPGKGNLILDNSELGAFGNIFLDGNDHTVQSNYLGVTPGGTIQTVVHTAISFSVNPPIHSNTLIGGNRMMGEGNIIGGCSFGIVSGDLANHDNPFVNIQIKGNYFGTDPSGQAVYPNQNGVFINAGQPWVNAYIGGTEEEANIFANTEETAIAVNGNSQQIYISRNSFYCNGEAIVIEPGANNDLPAPVIDTADVTLIAGTATPGDSVQVYVNDLTGCADTVACQGRTYLGTVIANDEGQWSLESFPIQLTGEMVAAALAIDADRNTSIFSNCQTVLCPASFGMLEVTLCPDESVIVNEVVYDINNPQGVETLEGANAIGCDSIVTIELRFFPPSADTLDLIICEGDSIEVADMFYDEVGQYEILLTDIDGCDSLVTLNLEVTPNPLVSLGEDINFFPGEPYTFEAQASVIVEQYEWSTGDTTAQITINMPGIYAVTIFDANGCSAADTVEAVLFTPTDEPAPETLLDIVPNPTSGQVWFRFSEKVSYPLELEIYNSNGRRLRQQQITRSSGASPMISLMNYPAGLYIVRLRQDKTTWVKRLVVQ